MNVVKSLHSILASIEKFQGIAGRVEDKEELVQSYHPPYLSLLESLRTTLH